VFDGLIVDGITTQRIKNQNNTKNKKTRTKKKRQKYNRIKEIMMVDLKRQMLCKNFHHFQRFIIHDK
jgi:hypothetical protein